MGRDRRRVRFLDGRKSRDLSPRGTYHRTSWNRRERRANGLRQHAAKIPAPAFALRATPPPAKKFSIGDFLINAQGEDVVAGIRTPMHLNEMAQAHAESVRPTGKSAQQMLEKHYRDMQDMEFTVEDGNALHAANARGQTHAQRPPSKWRWTWPTKA